MQCEINSWRLCIELIWVSNNESTISCDTGSPGLVKWSSFQPLKPKLGGSSLFSISDQLCMHINAGSFGIPGVKDNCWAPCTSLKCALQSVENNLSLDGGAGIQWALSALSDQLTEGNDPNDKHSLTPALPLLSSITVCPSLGWMGNPGCTG